MCYTVPAAAAIVSSILWHKTHDARIWWLNLMLIGGALFGVIDHAWNGELFLISPNIVKDLLLGVVITAGIFGSWMIMLQKSKSNPVLNRYLNIKA